MYRQVTVAAIRRVWYYILADAFAALGSHLEPTSVDNCRLHASKYSKSCTAHLANEIDGLPRSAQTILQQVETAALKYT